MRIGGLSSEEAKDEQGENVEFLVTSVHFRAVAKDCSIWLIDDFGSSLPESSRAEVLGSIPFPPPLLLLLYSSSSSPRLSHRSSSLLPPLQQRH